jgi:hypothetical protein
MSLAIPEILVKDKFITPDDREKIHGMCARRVCALLKVALNFGYISRKNYERSMINAGYPYQKIRQEEFDKDVLNKIELKFADEHLALPCDRE